MKFGSCNDGKMESAITHVLCEGEPFRLSACIATIRRNLACRQGNCVVCRRYSALRPSRSTSPVSAPAAPLPPAGIPTIGVHHLFDITGQDDISLSLPTDVAVGKEGHIYVVDGGNHRIVTFDRNGKYLRTCGGKGTGEGQFNSPVGVGTDGKGRVYVADTGNHRIQVFNADGRFQYTFPVVDNGLAIRPIDVAADASGSKIYVSGNNNHKIMAYTASGKPIRQWGGNGESGGLFRYPASVVVSPEGDLYVADVLNSRVQGFDEKGELLIQVGAWGVLPGQLFRPKGVAVDEKQRIYISDSYMDVIQVFDGEGRFQHVLGLDGTPQRFLSAGGIAIDRENRLYTAEILSNRVSDLRIYEPAPVMTPNGIRGVLLYLSGIAFAFAIVVVSSPGFAAPNQAAPASAGHVPVPAGQDGCLLCHKFPGLGRYAKDAQNRIVKRIFYVNEDIHKSSYHGRFNCIRTHQKSSAAKPAT